MLTKSTTGDNIVAHPGMPGDSMYRQLIESMPDAFLQTDDEFNILISNHSAVSFFGIEQEELKGRPLLLFLADVDQKIFLLEQLTQSDIRNLKLKFQNAEGRIRIAGVHVQKQLSEDRIQLNWFIRDITNEAIAQEKMEDEKEFYQHVIESISAEIAVFDTDNRYRFISKHALKDDEKRNWLIGHDDFDYCRAFGRDIKNAEERLKYHDIVNRTSQPVEWVEKIDTPHGQRHIYRILKPFVVNNGQMFKIGYGLDVTLLKETEKKLEQKQNYLQSLLDSLPDIIFRMDKEGRFIDYKADNVEALALAPQNFIGKTMYDLWPAEADFHMRHINKAFHEKRTICYEYPLNVSGQKGFYEARVNRNGDNELVVVIRNITQRKRAEFNMLKRERQLKEAQKIAHIGSFEWDMEECYIWCSDELYKLLGVDKNYHRGTIEELMVNIHAADIIIVQDALIDLMETGHTEPTEFRIVQKDGSVRHMYARIMETKETTKGEPVLGTVQDITYLKQFEITLFKAIVESEEAERNRIAADLHDGVCQDLAVAKLTIEMAQDLIDPSQEQLAKIVAKSRQIILDALNLTRKVSHDLVPKGLNELGFCSLIRTMVNGLNQVDKIKYFLSIEGSDDNLQQVVSINLIRIIQEFIRNSQMHSNTDRLAIDIRINQHQLMIVMKDFGKGFDYTKISHRQGIGILNMTKRIEIIGGKHEFEAVPGKGTSLMIQVPIR